MPGDPISRIIGTNPSSLAKPPRRPIMIHDAKRRGTHEFVANILLGGIKLTPFAPVQCIGAPVKDSKVMTSMSLGEQCVVEFLNLPMSTWTRSPESRVHYDRKDCPMAWTNMSAFLTLVPVETKQERG